MKVHTARVRCALVHLFCVDLPWEKQDLHGAWSGRVGNFQKRYKKVNHFANCTTLSAWTPSFRDKDGAPVNLMHAMMHAPYTSPEGHPLEFVNVSQVDLNRRNNIRLAKSAKFP